MKRFGYRFSKNQTELTSKFKNRKLGFHDLVFKNRLWQFGDGFSRCLIHNSSCCMIGSTVNVYTPPVLGAGGGYMFSGRPCRCPSVRPSIRDSRGSFMFPRYLQYLLMDFRQTFVTGASWDTDDLITFLGQKVKVQGHTIAAEAHSTRRSTLPSSATSSSSSCRISELLVLTSESLQLTISWTNSERKYVIPSVMHIKQHTVQKTEPKTESAVNLVKQNRKPQFFAKPNRKPNRSHFLLTAHP